ncbi:MAG: phosphoribosylglycinamide formyltransferase [Clostridiales bacterium]|jgi:phosphoribosylglycinamide formyltransferase-1|nr:phosphoribosylglycinamide formyltransferase [Clostridiales bacterium]
MYKVAVLASGSGSNLQAIIDNINNGYLNCSIEAVISDRQGCYAIERAKNNNIKTHILDRKILGEALSDDILSLVKGKADLIVLAGFLSILKGEILKEFKHRIINIHPSLIPAFCGNGMHGIKVHKSAIEYGVKLSGCTVHFVDEGCDTGPIILQSIVEVSEDDTPESLQRKVLIEEHISLSRAIKYLESGNIKVKGRRVIRDVEKD